MKYIMRLAAIGIAYRLDNLLQHRRGEIVFKHKRVSLFRRLVNGPKVPVGCSRTLPRNTGFMRHQGIERRLPPDKSQSKQNRTAENEGLCFGFPIWTSPLSER